MSTSPPPLPPRPRRDGAGAPDSSAAPGAAASSGAYGGTGSAGSQQSGASRSPSGPGSAASRSSSGSRSRWGSAGEVASLVPLIAGGGAFVISLVLAIVELADARASDLGVVTLPVIEPRLWWVALLGYLLTPIVVIVASGLDRLWQRNGLRDRRFTTRPVYGRVLTWLVRLGFVLALWHIVNLASAISDFWSNA